MPKFVPIAPIHQIHIVILENNIVVKDLSQKRRWDLMKQKFI